MDKINHNFYTILKSWFEINSPLFSTRISLLVGIVLSVFGIVLGSLEGSLALQTNGIIALIDVVNSLLFINAVSRSVRAPDYVFNYGYGKYESISILLSAVLLIVVLVYAVYESIQQFGDTEFEAGNYFLLSGYSLATIAIMYFVYRMQVTYSKRFRMPILKFDAELWKSDILIEGGVFTSLVIGAILINIEQDYAAKQVDSIFAIFLTVLALRVPLKGSADALNQLLDKTLPDDLQFELIAVVAENVNHMCEFKTVHTRQSGKDIFIEMDIVLPFDYTMDEKLEMEKRVQDQIREIYPTSISRIYAVPCPKDCIHGEQRKCPIHLAMKNKK
jgi:cation diffusion facilitator family transporter